MFEKLIGIKSKDNEEFREFVIVIMEGYERFKRLQRDMERSSFSRVVVKESPSSQSPQNIRKSRKII